MIRKPSLGRKVLRFPLFFLTVLLFAGIAFGNFEDYKYPDEEQEDTEPAEPPKEYPEENLKEGPGIPPNDDAYFPPQEKIQGRIFRYGRGDAWKWKTMNIYINNSEFTQEEIKIINSATHMLFEILEPCGVHIGIFKPDQQPYGDYVKIVNGKGCHAAQGRHGGAQKITLQRPTEDNKGSCVTRRIVLHEMMHALGFGHEHNRPDRDEHVEILWDNIEASQKYNFIKDRGNTFGIPYNVKSIMHYEDIAFAKEGTVSMKSKKGYQQIKYPKSELQPSDKKMIKKIYCTEPEKKSTAHYDQIKDLLKKYDDHEA